MLKKVLTTKNINYYSITENIKMENAPLFYENFIKENNFLGKLIFFDFSKVSFIDSSGIGIIIKCSEYLKEKSSKLYIVGINKSISTVFRLAGLHQILNIVEKEELIKYFTKEELEKIKIFR